MKKRSLDVVLLFVLVIARVRIDTLVDALVAPRPVETLQRVPLLGSLLPPRSLDLLQNWMIDPYSLLLITLTFGLLTAYLVLEALRDYLAEETLYHLKWVLILCLVLSTLVAQSSFLILLRHVSGPASYSHDGGVIQTEETIKYILAGKNPYVEDYVDTPMAEWGLEHKTALYHYPYLPWTFLFPAPFYLFSRAVLGWYDQRFVYLALFVIMLFLIPRLARSHTAKLCLTMTLGLNPIMGNDIIYGQNDSFVLFWIVLALYLLRCKCPTLSAIVFGLACASKSTAWFLAPFYLLYLLRGESLSLKNLSVTGASLLHRILPAVLVFAVLVLPFALWDLDAMVDDVWRWSSGTAEIPYQIRGWGLANLVLALGLVKSRLSYFPFWIFEFLFSLPLFLLLLRRQTRSNTLSTALYGYGALLLVFFYFSRFLNENYLGYILACLALAYFMGPKEAEEQACPPSLPSGL